MRHGDDEGPLGGGDSPGALSRKRSVSASDLQGAHHPPPGGPQHRGPQQAQRRRSPSPRRAPPPQHQHHQHQTIVHRDHHHHHPHHQQQQQHHPHQYQQQHQQQQHRQQQQPVGASGTRDSHSSSYFLSLDTSPTRTRRRAQPSPGGDAPGGRGHGRDWGALERKDSHPSSGGPPHRVLNVWGGDALAGSSRWPGGGKRGAWGGGRFGPQIAAEALSRGRWLVGLMAAQSLSSVILDRYSDLLREHLVITLFLTMLVGAGGNAGNQSSIKVIRGLATGALDTSEGCVRSTLLEQAAVGVLLGGALSAAGFARVYLTSGSLTNSAAIGLSVLGIVSSSCLLGSGLPFALARAGVDPANAGTSIQVLMDILGVAITCVTCDLVLRQLGVAL